MEPISVQSTSFHFIDINNEVRLRESRRIFTKTVAVVSPNQQHLWFSPGNAKQVDVSVVYGEIQKHGSGSSVQPQVVFEELQLNQRPLPGARQVLVESSASIFGHLTPEAASIRLTLGRVHPTVRKHGGNLRAGAFSMCHTHTWSFWTYAVPFFGPKEEVSSLAGVYML